MIAVFVNSDADWKRFEFSPRNRFIRIRKFDDLRGVEWDGVLIFPDFELNAKTFEAYLHLKTSKPELFNGLKDYSIDFKQWVKDINKHLNVYPQVSGRVTRIKAPDKCNFCNSTNLEFCCAGEFSCNDCGHFPIIK